MPRRVRRAPLSRVAACAVSFLLLSTRSTAAQSAAPDTASTLSGVYSEAQAKRGDETYQKHCAACHAPAGHSGPEFTRPWRGRPLFELYDLIRTTMPQDNPGRLSRGQYADVLAFLLQLNGLPAGAERLPADDERLQRIRFEVR